MNFFSTTIALDLGKIKIAVSGHGSSQLINLIVSMVASCNLMGQVREGFFKFGM